MTDAAAAAAVRTIFRNRTVVVSISAAIELDGVRDEHANEEQPFVIGPERDHTYTVGRRYHGNRADM